MDQGTLEASLSICRIYYINIDFDNEYVSIIHLRRAQVSLKVRVISITN